jgi:hypothetical protein
LASRHHVMFKYFVSSPFKSALKWTCLCQLHLDPVVQKYKFLILLLLIRLNTEFELQWLSSIHHLVTFV